MKTTLWATRLPKPPTKATRPVPRLSSATVITTLVAALSQPKKPREPTEAEWRKHPDYKTYAAAFRYVRLSDAKRHAAIVSAIRKSELKANPRRGGRHV